MGSYLAGRTTRVSIKTRMSKPDIIRKGLPQGGPDSPRFWREYMLNMIMTLHESDEWDNERHKDRVKKLNLEGDREY